MIYRHYFTVKGGYHYHHESCKLITEAGERIDLALMLTSRLIAQECRLLPFQFNTLHFSTESSSHERSYAGYFDCDLNCRYDYLLDLVKYLYICLTPEIEKIVESRYPQFKLAMDESKARQARWRDNGALPRGTWGEVPSLWREATELAWRTAALLNPHKAEEAIHELWMHHADPFWRFRLRLRETALWDEEKCRLSKNPLRLIFYDHKPWDIPTEIEAWRLSEATEDARTVLDSERKFSLGHDYRWSAASLAIRFLSELPRALRLEVRRLALFEDQIAVGCSSSHALGLESFCHENPFLRVERRLSLFGIMQDHQRKDTRSQGHVAMEAISVWLTEALRASRALPAGSFTFLLDGTPAPDKATAVFDQVVHIRLAEHRAVEEYMKRGVIEYQRPLHRRHGVCYVMEDLPHAVRLLQKNDENLRCNFDPGFSWDMENVNPEPGSSVRDFDRLFGYDPDEYPRLDFNVGEIICTNSIAIMEDLPDIWW